MKKIFTLSLLLLSVWSCYSQAKKTTDPVLFTYAKKPVTKSEFLRMYTKNLNNQKPDFSEKALREYLTLYSRFKMKVAEAEAMKLDTLKNIDAELTSYKKQLAKTYLTDNEVKDKLIREAYERMKTEVEASHILITFPRGTDDTMAAYQKIDSLYRALTQNHADWNQLVAAYSEDRGTVTHNGSVGFMTALQFVYAFETAAYTTPKGQYSKPFRTIYGYHIVKKLAERPSRGEVQVAQILIEVRKSSGEAGDKAAKQKIDSIATAIKNGADFTKMVDQYSEDKFSKNSDGVLPSFGVGVMNSEYEDAAFALKNPGDISAPVKTTYGYHLIKLIKKTPLKPFDSIKTELTRRVEKDGRTDFAKVEYTNRTKQRLHYVEHPEALTALIVAIKDTDLTNGTYKAKDYKKYTDNLFDFAGTAITQYDFARYIEDYTKGRMFGSKESSLRSLFKNYSEKVLYDYQENKLLEENADFRNLINEYRDGIMLFELQDKMVWSKASTDTVGLKRFHELNSAKYIWPPTIKGTMWTAQDEATIKRVGEELDKRPKKSAADIASTLNEGTIKVSYQQGKFEQARFVDELKLEPGHYSKYYQNDDKTYSLVDVEEKFDMGTEKTLSEARGMVVSDYQDFLEKYWIAEMEMKYPLEVNEAVFKSMIEK